MGRTFIGFYWTQPVKWLGMHQLPQKPGCKSYDLVDGAAAVSRTIRYQRERVRRWIAEQAGTLVREFVFMEVQPDRVSESVTEVLDVLAPLCAQKGGQSGATLVYVDFSRTEGMQAHNWRRHQHLQSYIQKRHLESVELLPEPVVVPDGRFKPFDPFDPIAHFRSWRTRGEAAKAERSQVIQPRLAALLQEVPKGRGRHAAMANILNEERVVPLTGRPWSADNVRTTCKRLGLDD
jgi:hypothetical protein